MSTNMRQLRGGDIEEGRFNGNVRDTEIKISANETYIKKISDIGNTNVKVSDTEKWASSLKSMLEDVPHYMCSRGHTGRITRIPENLRNIDINSYEPCYLSIGPYHHGKPSVQRMEKTKWIALKCFLKQNPGLKLKDILKEIKIMEPAARSFYTNVEMNSEKFVQMLLVDSLYLVIVFCEGTKSEQRNHIQTKICGSMNNEGGNYVMNQINEDIEFVYDSGDRQEMERVDHDPTADNNKNGPRWFWTLLVHDLFLLENQLPFFILQKMHNLVYDESETQLTVAITNMFRYLLLDYVMLDSEMVISPTVEVHHLLHLCHMFFHPRLQQDFTNCQLEESSQMFRLGSAVQLYESGVRFITTSDSNKHSLLDITFSSSGKMVMPCLHVDDNTNSLLRNLIALEQMKYPSMGLNVSAYAVLLLHLITTPADVKLLRRKGIIKHHLASDKEMMFLINRLSVGLAFDYVEDEYSLKPIFNVLKSYSDHRVPRWRAWLKHKYFSNPWTTISLMAASLLLFLTAVQTYYALYSYYHPRFYDQS